MTRAIWHYREASVFRAPRKTPSCPSFWLNGGQVDGGGVDGMIARRTAVTNDLLADDGYVQKVDTLGDPL